MWMWSVVLLRSGKIVCLAFFYPTSLWPYQQLCLWFLHFHRFRGHRLSCVARTCLTSHFVLRLYAVLVFTSSLMNQCWLLRCTHMVLRHGILGDGMLTEAFKCWLIRTSYLRHFKGSEKENSLNETPKDNHQSFLFFGQHLIFIMAC